MKNPICILFLLVFYFYFGYSEGIKTYEPQSIATIKGGTVAGEIGFNPKMAQMGIAADAIAISKENLLYVSDLYNKRINVYELNLNFIKNIDLNDKSLILPIISMLIDDDDNIVTYIDSQGLTKFDQTGNEIYIINEKELAFQFSNGQKPIQYGSNLIFYNSPLDGKNRTINIISQSGKIEYAVNLDNTLLKENKETNTSVNKLSGLEDDIIIKINIFFKEKKIVQFKNRIITPVFADHREYYNLIKKNKDVIVADRINEANLNLINFKLVDYDKDANSYWRANTKNQNKWIIIILSKNGEILDCFFNVIESPYIAISPEGDLYFLKRTKDITNFYKITRRW